MNLFTVSNQSQARQITEIRLRQCLTALEGRTPAGVGQSEQSIAGVVNLRYTELRANPHAAHVCHL